jgi:hypothetical protein
MFATKVINNAFFKQGNRSDAIGLDLAETYTKPALECFNEVSINI